MWYEFLPSFSVILGGLVFSHVFNYYSNKLVFGQPFRRTVLTTEDAYMVLRDSRISNIDWAYKYVGLENIPDADNLQTAT